ncbi:MAG: CRTAC1 family protein [Ardenticatenaceae bacterium]
MKKKVFAVFSLIGLLVIGLFVLFFPFERWSIPPAALEVQSFTEIEVGFEHEVSAREIVYPFMGAAAIDVDGNGMMEVFIGGGDEQEDALLTFEDNQLVNIIKGSGLSSQSATYGATSIDMDNDGDSDLLVARDDGLTLYLNEGKSANGMFVPQPIPLSLTGDAVPFSVAVSDIEQDGDADLYVSVFIEAPSFRPRTFNDVTHAKRNIMLLNNGDLTFTDITEQSGTASRQNSWGAVFVDLDDDGLQDLVVAQEAGTLELFRNTGNTTFQPIPTNSGLGFWMGVAVGDIDNDGDQDLFFSNVGNSLPPFPFTSGGDLLQNQEAVTEWLLLRNDGNFNFTNVTDAYNLTGYGFGWGAAFSDLNLDGHLDLLVAQNHTTVLAHRRLPLPGKAMLQVPPSQGKGFYHINELELNNRFFGQSPLVADIDGDGRQDLLWINRNAPTRAFLNQSGHNFVKVVLPDSAEYLGTKVTVKTKEGTTYTQEAITSVGNMTDQSPELIFGLGNATQISHIEIKRPNRKAQTIKSPPINQTIVVE